MTATRKPVPALEAERCVDDPTSPNWHGNKTTRAREEVRPGKPSDQDHALRLRVAALETALREIGENARTRNPDLSIGADAMESCFVIDGIVRRTLEAKKP